jgi:hypothetical protein
MGERYLKAIAALLGICAGALTLAALNASPAYAQSTDDNLAGASDCFSPFVNDAGTAAGNCDVNITQQAFVRLPSASSSTLLAPLPASVSGSPCMVNGINNAAAGNEIIIGGCVDANAVMQGVFWSSASPTTAPTLLQPLSLLKLLPDAQTVATAFNTPGLIVGISIDNAGDETPVSWSPAGAPTQLAAPLPYQNTNCVPVGVNDARTPSIIANCPDAGADGGNQAVLWQGTTSTYAVLPVPSGAAYCTVSSVNLVGQILGLCFYGTATDLVAVWGAGGTGPTVLTKVGGASVSVTFAVQINDSGMVASNYLADGASAGFEEPCIWNPSGGNTDAIAISAPGGSTGPATIASIGDNGKAAGTYETAAGLLHPFHVEPGSSTAIDDGSSAGGPNTVVASMSKGGIKEAVVSQNGSELTQDETQSVP